MHEICALPTFALLTPPATAALLITTSVRAMFLVAAGLGLVVPSQALVASFYCDPSAGPACAPFLALSVAVAAIVSVYTGARRPLPRFERQPQARTAPGLMCAARIHSTRGAGCRAPLSRGEYRDPLHPDVQDFRSTTNQVLRRATSPVWALRRQTALMRIAVSTVPPRQGA